LGLRLLQTLLLAVALVSPALAQDGPGIVAGVKDAANQAATYLQSTAKAGKRPDFSKPPLSNLFARVFDVQQLAALPPPTAKDVLWIADWTAAANQVSKSILYFGITPPADPVADAPAIKRNMSDFEDQAAAAMSFLIRIAARQTQSMFLFMNQLTPEQRTPIREEGFSTARVGAEEVVYGALITIAQRLKPANARLVSAAIRDTTDAWVTDILPKDRQEILNMLAKAQEAVKDDDETRKNLAAFGTALAAAK
jgi:hypothetical protein